MPPQCGREPLSPFAESLWKTKPHLAGVPFPFVWAGRGSSMYLSQKMSRSPNLKNKKLKILEKMGGQGSRFIRRSSLKAIENVEAVEKAREGFKGKWE